MVNSQSDTFSKYMPCYFLDINAMSVSCFFNLQILNCHAVYLKKKLFGSKIITERLNKQSKTFHKLKTLQRQMCGLSLFLPAKADRWYIQMREPRTWLISDLGVLVANSSFDSSILKGSGQTIVLCMRMFSLYRQSSEHDFGEICTTAAEIGTRVSCLSNTLQAQISSRPQTLLH